MITSAQRPEVPKRTISSIKGLSRLQLLNENVPKLDQAGWAGPLDAVPVAVMLQADRPFRRDAGNRRVFDDLLPVEHDVDLLADERDLERVPLADVAIGVHLRRGGGTQRRRQALIAADAPQLAGTCRPAPDIHLRPAAEQDSRVGVG